MTKAQLETRLAEAEKLLAETEEVMRRMNYKVYSAKIRDFLKEPLPGTGQKGC